MKLFLIFHIGAGIWFATSPAAAEVPRKNRAEIFYFDYNYSVRFEMITALEKAAASLDYLKIEKAASRLTYTDYRNSIVEDSRGLAQKELGGQIAYTKLKATAVLKGGKSFIYSDRPLPPELRRIMEDEVSGVFTPREAAADLVQGTTRDGKTFTAVSLKEGKAAPAMMPTFMLTFRISYKGEPFTVTEVGMPLGLSGFDRRARERAAHKETARLLSIGLGTDSAEEMHLDLEKALSRLADLKTDIAAVDRDDIKALWRQSAVKNPALEHPEISFICSNFQTSDPALAGLIKPYNISVINGIRTAFLSFLPSDTPAISSGSLAAASFINPFQKDYLRELVRTLRTGEQAEVITAVSRLDGEEFSQLLKTGGIDIVIGPRSGENTSSKKTRVELTDWAADSHTFPAMIVSRDYSGLGEISVELDADGGLKAVEAGPVERDPADGPDDGRYSDLKEKLMRHFFGSEEPLLPDIRRVYPEPESRHKYNVYYASDFFNLVAAALRRQYRTEIALALISPLPISVYGDIPSSLVRTWMKPADSLIIASVPGILLKTLMPQIVFGTGAGGEDRQKYFKKDYFAVSGLAKDGTVSGLQLQAEERYLTALSANTLEALKKNIHAKGIRIVKPEDTALDTLVLEILAGLKSGKGPDPGWERAIRRLVDNAPERRPLWRINLREMSLLMTNTAVRGSRNFAGVSDSRINASDQTLIQGSGRLFSELFLGRTRLDLGVSADFGKVTARAGNQPKVVSESADQLVFEGEFKQEMGGFNNSFGAGKYGPFANLAYDTEFTRRPALPYRKIVRGKAGFKLFEGSKLQEFYAALVGEQNYTNKPAKTDYAAETGFKAAVPVPGTALTLLSEGIYRNFAYARSDTNADLKQNLELRAKLSAKLYNSVMLSPFINYYMATGKLFGGTATNTTVGVSIDYNHLFKLKY